MPDILPEFEGKDQVGDTKQVSGSVTTVISIPTVAGPALAEVLFRCSIDQPFARRLLVSVDGGTNFTKMRPGEIITWIMKGGRTQVQVKSDTGQSVAYDVWYNEEMA